MIRSVHNVAGNGIIVAALVQIIVLFLGRQLRPSWFVGWVSGVLLALNVIGLGWTAMILNWSQEGFWRLKIELATLQSIPLVGNTIRDILTGGGGINSDTVMHFYTLHSYVLSLGAVLLSVVHLGSLIIHQARSPSSTGRTIRTSCYYPRVRHPRNRKSGEIILNLNLATVRR